MQPGKNQDVAVTNGYDYQLQVWVKNGIVQPCNHSEIMRQVKSCCDQNLYKHLTIQQARELAKSQGKL